MTASPLPWRKGGMMNGSIDSANGKSVCRYIKDVDIDLILKAVNNQESLLSACAAMLLIWGSDDEDAILKARKQAREAIERAIYPRS